MEGLLAKGAAEKEVLHGTTTKVTGWKRSQLASTLIIIDIAKTSTMHCDEDISGVSNHDC